MENTPSNPLPAPWQTSPVLTAEIQAAMTGEIPSGKRNDGDLPCVVCDALTSRTSWFWLQAGVTISAPLCQACNPNNAATVAKLRVLRGWPILAWDLGIVYLPDASILATPPEPARTSPEPV